MVEKEYHKGSQAQSGGSTGEAGHQAIEGAAPGPDGSGRRPLGVQLGSGFFSNSPSGSAEDL